jgi:lipoprotein-anchoring transpeptidase ErfK/SrfK
MHRFTRRQFLALSSLSLTALAFRQAARPLPPDDQPPLEYGLGRVIAPRVTIRTAPDPDAEKVYYRYEDRVINIQSLVESDAPPAHNRLWYQVQGGYVHSSYIQPVRLDLQKPLTEFPGSNFLVEVTVPFVDSRASPNPHSERGYRHYYGTTHWVTAIRIDKNDNVWYRIWDDKWRTWSYILGQYLRPITAEELTPLSPTVTDKLLEVDTDNQWAHAYEDGHEVYSVRTATGDWFTVKGVLKDFTTPTGEHKIERKTPSRHMAGGDLAAGEGYDLPGVPWVSYFTSSGVAFHGTYWHNDFGLPRSHGCVNVTTEAAKWIYRWSLPHVPVNEGYVWELGTKVIVT